MGCRGGGAIPGLLLLSQPYDYHVSILYYREVGVVSAGAVGL